MLELRIDAGPSPERATQVRLAEWEGPLGLLLSLIEARRLDVLDVPLGSLAEAYLDALAAIEVDRMGHISAFIEVAGQLILIKSRAMLPRPAAADVADLPEDGPDPEVLLAGLLHDAGKGQSGFVARILYSLSQAYGGWIWGVGILLPPLTKSMTRLRAHPALSAMLAEAAGCSPVTVALIRHQDDPPADDTARRFHLADDAN